MRVFFRFTGLRNQWLSLPLLLLCIASTLSCSYMVEGSREHGEAHFDYFSYTGTDSYYERNPLPGEGYFYNPVLPGWNSEPSVCSNGNEYYLVTSSNVYYPGVPIFCSDNLVNWAQIGFVLNQPSQLKLDGQSTSQGIFAPEISYNPQDQTYYVIATNIGGGNFFVKTRNPTDNWSDPIWLPDVHGTDPSFFFDENGHAYILNSDEPAGFSGCQGQGAIIIREYDLKNARVLGPEKVLIDESGFFRKGQISFGGPNMYKIDGEYFLIAAVEDSGFHHSEIILKANSPMGEFLPWQDNPILAQGHLMPDSHYPISSPGHADLIKDHDAGNWWSVFPACRPLKNNFENLGIETFLMPVKWSEDGFPYITRNKDFIPMILKKDGISGESDCFSGNFTIRDEFNSDTLRSDWFTLRSAAKEVYSFTERSGYVSLKCIDVSASEKKTPAFIARRLQHHSFECETELILRAADNKDAAGILLYKDENHQYFLAVAPEGKAFRISLKKISELNSECIAAQIVGTRKSIRLKVLSTGENYSFYYALSGSDWQVLAADVDAYFLSTANASGHTGTTIGMYATGKFDDL